MKGRGTSENPKNRFEELAYDPHNTDLVAIDELDPPHPTKTQFFKDTSKSLLTSNDSPDVGFTYSLNAYRGCEHGCIYCYARPYHEYLGLSAGVDFESKIFIKENAAELLRAELCKPSWVPEPIGMSGVTDCYQPAERHFRLTRSCLEVLLEFGNPAFIITKNHLILRDKDLLSEMAKKNLIQVVMSVTTLDSKLARVLEPRTSHPRARLKAIELLSQAGVPVSVNMAPIIPGLTDHEIPDVLKACREQGATGANYTIVRLPYGVKDLFSAWLEENFPDRKGKVLARIQSMRGGKLNVSEFHSRMTGEGIFAEQIKKVFALWKKKLGYQKGSDLSTAHFKRPHDRSGQMDLF